MTAYAGQTVYGGIELLPSEIERGLEPHMLFTERDRRRAYEDSQVEIPYMHFDLYERLTMLAEAGSHQAQWYIDQLHEKARLQGQTIINSIKPIND